MDINKVDMFMLSKGYLFPNAQLPLLREMLIKAGEDEWVKINTANFRSPITALILSLVAGTYGVDRFYLGHYLLGSGKLLLAILLIGWLIGWFNGQLENWNFLYFGGTLIMTLTFWGGIDIFLVSKTAREQNLNILLTILN